MFKVISITLAALIAATLGAQALEANQIVVGVLFLAALLVFFTALATYFFREFAKDSKRDFMDFKTNPLSIFATLYLFVLLSVGLGLYQKGAETINLLADGKVTRTATAEEVDILNAGKSQEGNIFAHSDSEGIEVNNGKKRDFHTVTDTVEITVKQEVSSNEYGVITKILWAIGEVGMFLSVFVALLIILPLAKAARDGNVLKSEIARLVNLVGWMLLGMLPAVAMAKEIASSAIPTSFLTNDAFSLRLDMLFPGIVIIMLAAIWKRGSEAVELEETTV